MLKSCSRNAIESLESRRLLAATLTAGLLRVVGDESTANSITVGVSGGDPTKVEVSLNGVDSEFATADVQRVLIIGGSQNDTLTVDDSYVILNMIRGLAGNDTITGGGGRSDLRGDTGNDTITGNGTRNFLFGNDGDDLITGESSSRNLVVAGDGVDTVTGGDVRDILFGNGGADSIDGGNGNDKLFGLAGADTLLGNDGDDTLFGGGNPDTIDGGAGTNVIRQREASNITAILDDVNASTI